MDIIRERWEWRRRIFQLALFEIRIEGRGAALSWAWFFVRPIAYIACFWFAIGLGLRGGASLEGQPPYILWLSAGMIPWMFMRDILTQASKSFTSKGAIVTTMKMPLSCITSIYAVASLLIQLALFAILLLIYFPCGMGIDVYLLQVPFLLVLMLVFWDMVALMLSTLGAISKDFSQVVSILSAPLFWVSGIIFNIDNFPIERVKPLFNLNPITFFANGYRDAFYYKTWFFSDAQACIGFTVVFAITLLVTAWLYRTFRRVVPDLV